MAARTGGALRLARTSGTPLWSQLLDDLVRRLEAGSFTHEFPTELELVEEYDVSRHTVREALRRLRESGAISSHRGRVTVIRQASIEPPLGALYSLFREVEARGMVQRSEVRTRVVRIDEQVASQLKLPAHERFVHIERLRLADEKPLAWDRVWMPLRIAEVLLNADLTHSGLYDELRRGGVVMTGGREHIEAVVPTAQQRRLLGVPAGVAALAIERVGRANGRPMELRQTLVRGDRFGLTAEWSATKTYHLDIAAGR